jgi:threonine dehydrogenase-like Zn-dependent dehydrogenase
VRQARWTADGLAVAGVEPPPLPEGFVRVRVHACGICGTDLHLWRREVPPPEGGCPGHEIAGVPVAGPAGLPDRLHAVEPRVWCGRCDLCAAGNRHLCARGGLLGLGLPGGLADLVDAPRASLHPVADSIAPAVAALSEPLAVCVRAIHLARVSLDSRVLVLGAGTIGLLAGLLARDRAAEVAVTARHSHQEEAAKALGIAAIRESDTAAFARERAPDVVIETVGGHADTLDHAIAACRPTGRVIVLGVFAGPRPVDARPLLLKEITVVGSNTYGTTARGAEFRAAVDLLPRHAAELGRLLTHRFPLDRVSDAFACAADKRSRAIKVTVTPLEDA